MKITICFLLLSCSLYAQNEQVMLPINALFEGMKKGDSAMVHRAFHPTAALRTVAADAKTGNPELRTSRVESFLKAVGSPHKDVWNELIWDPKIEIDGNMAQVWVKYAFYAGSTFSHCGVDAFQLIRDESGAWKIFTLSDTRQKEGCNVPAEVSKQIK